MSRTRVWFARDAQLTADPKVQTLADDHGASGVLVLEEMFALAKLADDDGLVKTKYSVLARRAFLKTAKQARQIVHDAASLGLIEVLDEADSTSLIAQIPRWSRWQIKDPTAAQRKEKSRIKSRQGHGEQRDFSEASRDSHGPTGTEVQKNPPNPPPDFCDWIAHHQAMTGHKPPGERTKAYQALAESFNARVSEGYTLDELKLATAGAHGDDYRRDNGYDTAGSILRPTKVADLIARGQRRVGRREATEAERAARWKARGGTVPDQPPETRAA